jgi:hypothetical protein
MLITCPRCETEARTSTRCRRCRHSVRIGSVSAAACDGATEAPNTRDPGTWEPAVGLVVLAAQSLISWWKERQIKRDCSTSSGLTQTMPSGPEIAPPK